MNVLVAAVKANAQDFYLAPYAVMVIYQNQYINLYPLIQITFKFLYTYNFHFRKRNIFQDLKVLIFCNNTLCICSNGTIYKLIVIFV